MSTFTRWRKARPAACCAPAKCPTAHRGPARTVKTDSNPSLQTVCAVGLCLLPIHVSAGRQVRLVDHDHDAVGAGQRRGGVASDATELGHLPANGSWRRGNYQRQRSSVFDRTRFPGANNHHYQPGQSSRGSYAGCARTTLDRPGWLPVTDVVHLRFGGPSGDGDTRSTHDHLHLRLARVPRQRHRSIVADGAVHQRSRRPADLACLA